MHMRSGEFSVLYLPPNPIDSPQSWSATSGWGLGVAGLPDPDVFGSTGERSTFAATASPATAVVAVVSALGSTLSAESVELTRSTRSQPLDHQDPEAGQVTAAGLLYPRLGGAELSVNSAAGPKGERVIGLARVFAEGEMGQPPGQNPWAEVNGGALPQLGASSATGNVFALFDWLRHLRSADTRLPQRRPARSSIHVHLQRLRPGCGSYCGAASAGLRGLSPVAGNLDTDPPVFLQVSKRSPLPPARRIAGDSLRVIGSGHPC